MKIISRRTVWRQFIHLEELQMELGDGSMATREVHDHGNAACVLPVDYEREKLLLVGQVRMGVMCNPDPEVAQSSAFIEVVAGLIDKGESPEGAARREALEETGFEVRDLEKIAECFAIPSTVTEYFYLYGATYDSASPVHKGGGLAVEGEEIEVIELSLAKAQKMLTAGKFRDAKTIMALNWLFWHKLR